MKKNLELNNDELLIIMNYRLCDKRGKDFILETSILQYELTVRWDKERKLKLVK